MCINGYNLTVSYTRDVFVQDREAAALRHALEHNLEFSVVKLYLNTAYAVAGGSMEVS